MSPRRSRIGWWICSLLSCALAGCTAEHSPPARALLLPEVAMHQHAIDRIELRGAGNRTQVTMVRTGGNWRVVERDWPADAGRISQSLFLLSQVHRQEAKTRQPELYARLGLEPISSASASGIELRLSGGGANTRVLIGNEHAKFDSHYVRVGDEPQAWLTDLPLHFERSPAHWLDRRLVDWPLPRILGVSVVDPSGSFTLSHRDDRFRIDGIPAGAMHDSRRGDTLAAVLDQLVLLDVESATTTPGKPDRRLVFAAHDGSRLVAGAWRIADKVWIALSSDVDPVRAQAWVELRPKAATLKTLHANAAALTQRWSGRRFLLTDENARVMMMGRDELLSGQALPGEPVP